MEVALGGHLEALMVDQREADQEARLVGLMEVGLEDRLVGQMVDHLEGV